ncbi:MAG TPA: electron transport complex subunit RsxG [Methylophaga sp.]|nr:electron transport complex subunit RsxG [Methylophaga sp.]
MHVLWQNPILRVGLMMAIFAIGATALVSLTETNTREQIANNEREALLEAIKVLVPADKFDNQILQDTLTLPPTPAIGTTEPSTVYRARQNGKPSAAVFTVIAPDGYSGSISMLVGINYDGTLAGVRVISHKETPGLGDKIEAKRNDWILQFEGLSLNNPEKSEWKVKKDGGHFDQFTGATITPRAIVNALREALVYFKNNRDKLFAKVEDKP